MALYICYKKNPWIKQGAIYELFEDGFQEVQLDLTGKPIGNKGIILPEADIKPYVIKMLNKGFDKPELRTRKSAAGFSDVDWDEVMR